MLPGNNFVQVLVLLVEYDKGGSQAESVRLASLLHINVLVNVVCDLQ